MTDKHSATRLYLAVFLPLLPSERAVRAGAVPPGTPFALTGKARGTVRLAAVDAGALALGIVPGLTLADARARLPDLVAIDHDPAADAALLDWLADGCDRYTPSVATDPPQGLTLDITGCAEPFGDAAGLADDLGRRLLRHGLTPRLALASTPDAASALARFGGDVAGLPVAALKLDAETDLALRRAGLKTIGDLAGRPRGPLAARFGAAMPVLLSRLLGEEDVRIVPRRRRPELCVERRFLEPVTRAEAALLTLDRLMAEAAVILSARGAGGRRFEASLFRGDGHVARLGVGTSQPTRNPKTLARLFREGIETLSEPLDPGFGYDLIRLAVPVTEPMVARQLRLEGGGAADAEIAILIDRLGARLGHHRVRRFRPGHSHIPERAAFELAVAEAFAPGAWPAAEPGEPPLRPLHMFDPPQRIEVIADVPDGPPRRFRWRRALHEVTRAEGPERIAAEWWRWRDGRGVTRDYYRVEDALGRRFWVFRRGLYGVERAPPDWYLHGQFA